MLTERERKYALYGAILLLVHTAITAVAAVAWLTASNTAWFHMGSALCYLAGFLCYFLCFRRSQPVLSVLFAVSIALGIVFGLITKLIENGMTEPGEKLQASLPYLQEGVPIAMLFLAAILLRFPGFLKVMGTFFGIGALCWLISDIVHVRTSIEYQLRFGAEFFGMNAMLALVVWSFVMAKSAVTHHDAVEESARTS